MRASGCGSPRDDVRLQRASRLCILVQPEFEHVCSQSIEHNGPTPELRDTAPARQRIAMYYANLVEMDHNAGKVLDALHALNLDKDTIVLYTSDYGEMLGEHGLWQKFVFYESSVRVSLIGEKVWCAAS